MVCSFYVIPVWIVEPLRTVCRFTTSSVSQVLSLVESLSFAYGLGKDLRVKL